MNIAIRPMMLADLDEVMEIEPASFGDHHWSRQSFVNELSNPRGYYFVAYALNDKRILGYTGFWLIVDEAHITTLAVHPAFRRQHIGEMLLICDIEEAKKIQANWVTLEVRASNQAAQNLYYKYGFKSLGIRQNYYQDNNEDAIVLWTDRINTPAFAFMLDNRIKELSLQSFSIKGQSRA